MVVAWTQVETSPDWGFLVIPSSSLPPSLPLPPRKVEKRAKTQSEAALRNEVTIVCPSYSSPFLLLLLSIMLAFAPSIPTADALLIMRQYEVGQSIQIRKTRNVPVLSLLGMRIRGSKGKKQQRKKGGEPPLLRKGKFQEFSEAVLSKQKGFQEFTK